MITSKRAHCTILSSILALSVLAGAGSLPAARAQPAGASAGDPAPASADQLFEQAQAAFRAGDLQRAYEAYVAAWRIQKSYDIAGNLGNVEMKLGKMQDAAGHLSYALRHFPPTGLSDQKNKLTARLNEARSHVGAVRVVVNRPNATVTIDGVPLGVSPLEDDVFVSPGAHTIEAKLWGYKDARQEHTATKGSSEIVTLVLVAEPEPEPARAPERVFATGPAADPRDPAAPPPNPSAGSEPVMIGGFLLSGALVSVGSILWVYSESLRDDTDAFRAQAGPSGCYRPEGTNIQACEDFRSADDTRFATETYGMLATGMGVSVAVATVVYVLVWRWSAPDSPPPRAVAAPTCGAAGCGFALTGRW